MWVTKYRTVTCQAINFIKLSIYHPHTVSISLQITALSFHLIYVLLIQLDIEIRRRQASPKWCRPLTYTARSLEQLTLSRLWAPGTFTCSVGRFFSVTQFEHWLHQFSALLWQFYSVVILLQKVSSELDFSCLNGYLT